MSQEQQDNFLARIIDAMPTMEPRRKRSRVDLTGRGDEADDADDDGKVPPAVVPVLSILPGIPRETFVAIFDHSFRPKKDLIKLRLPEYNSSLADDEAYEYKNTSSGLQLRKVASLKDWGHDHSLWAHCFSNYMTIWASLFGDKYPSCWVGMTMFHRSISDFARIYRWQDAVLPLALSKHQLLVDRGLLTIARDDWRIEQSLAGSYLRHDLLLPSSGSKSNAPGPPAPPVP